MTVRTFETGDFEASYTVEVDPQFPGDGDWRCQVVAFDRDGNVIPQVDSRWGAPLVLRIQPAAGESWVGMFAAGGVGLPIHGAFATPAPDLIAVVVDGLAYLADTRTPGEPARIVQLPVHQVAPCSEPPLLLFVGFTDIVAVGPGGVAWSTPRLCVDDLKVIRAHADGITCSCDNLGHSPTIELDPYTGTQTAGTRMSSFWPPDALA